MRDFRARPISSPTASQGQGQVSSIRWNHLRSRRDPGGNSRSSLTTSHLLDTRMATRSRAIRNFDQFEFPKRAFKMDFRRRRLKLEERQTVSSSSPHGSHRAAPFGNPTNHRRIVFIPIISPKPPPTCSPSTPWTHSPRSPSTKPAPWASSPAERKTWRSPNAKVSGAGLDRALRRSPLQRLLKDRNPGQHSCLTRKPHSSHSGKSWSERKIGAHRGLGEPVARFSNSVHRFP